MMHNGFIASLPREPSSDAVSYAGTTRRETSNQRSSVAFLYQSTNSRISSTRTLLSQKHTELTTPEHHPHHSTTMSLPESKQDASLAGTYEARPGVSDATPAGLSSTSTNNESLSSSVKSSLDTVADSTSTQSLTEQLPSAQGAADAVKAGAASLVAGVSSLAVGVNDAVAQNAAASHPESDNARTVSIMKGLLHPLQKRIFTMASYGFPAFESRFHVGEHTFWDCRLDIADHLLFPLRLTTSMYQEPLKTPQMTQRIRPLFSRDSNLRTTPCQAHRMSRTLCQVRKASPNSFPTCRDPAGLLTRSAVTPHKARYIKTESTTSRPSCNPRTGAHTAPQVKWQDMCLLSHEAYRKSSRTASVKQVSRQRPHRTPRLCRTRGNWNASLCAKSPRRMLARVVSAAPQA